MIFTGVCLIISLIADVKRTVEGIKRGMLMFLKLLPMLLLTLILVSIVLYLLPDETLTRFMGEGSGFKGLVTAAVIGSVALIPGFIAYPLCGLLLQNGVDLSVIAVFITTLMMTGFVTLPIEAKFFGWMVSILRNLLSLAAALIVGLIMGLAL